MIWEFSQKLSSCIGWTDGQTDKRLKNGQTDILYNFYTIIIYLQKDGQTNGWKDKRTNGQTDVNVIGGQTDIFYNFYTIIFIFLLNIKIHI